MEIEFIGVGEAFDPDLGNASYLIKASDTHLMIDCGYAVPKLFFERNYPCQLVDALYFTHFHADHTFGLPPLLFRWAGEGRTKPLVIIGQTGTERYLSQLLDLAYVHMRSKLTFELLFIEKDDRLDFRDLSLSFADTAHSIKNHAIRITHENTSLGISGDGILTNACRELFYECDILVHESFTLQSQVKGHTNALDVIQFAQSMPKLKILALVHIQRQERQNQLAAFQLLEKQLPCRLLIPHPGDRVVIS